jgi:hypothetical protein
MPLRPASRRSPSADDARGNPTEDIEVRVPPFRGADSERISGKLADRERIMAAGLSVLVIDDDVAHVSPGQFLLEPQGREVLVAYAGRAGLTTAALHDMAEAVSRAAARKARRN